MYARSTTILGQPALTDAGIQHVRDGGDAGGQRDPRLCRHPLLVDRSSGRCIVTTAWESEEALVALPTS